MNTINRMINVTGSLALFAWGSILILILFFQYFWALIVFWVFITLVLLQIGFANQQNDNK